MSSILTNTSAMVALQTLKSINSNLEKTQSEISTGKSIASARDNSAVWAISKVMESDVEGFKAISDSLSLGESTVAVARSASETVTDLLTDIKGRVVAAQEENVDREKIQSDINALRDQIGSVVNAAQFNGLNLVTGTEDMNILSSLDRSGSGTVTARNITVARQDLTTFAGTYGNGATLAGNITSSAAAIDSTGAANDLELTFAGAAADDLNVTINGTTFTQAFDTDAATTVDAIRAQINQAGLTGITAGGAGAVLELANTNSFDTFAVSWDSGATNTIAVTNNGNSADDQAATTGSGSASLIYRAEEVELSNAATVNEGDSYRVTVNGNNYDYVAGQGENMEDVARGLKTAIDSGAETGVTTQVVQDETSGAWRVLVDYDGSDPTAGATMTLSDAGQADGVASGGLFGLDNIDVTTNEGADAALANMETLIQNAIDAAASFGSAEGRINTQSEFVSTLTDSLRTGIGTLVDADMEEASARLQALQVQQQLATLSDVSKGRLAKPRTGKTRASAMDRIGLRTDQRRLAEKTRPIGPEGRPPDNRPPDPAGRIQPAIAGVIVTATTKDQTSMMTTAIAMDPTKSPAGPGRRIIGVKLSAVVAVDAKSGMVRRPTAPRTASSRGRPERRRRAISSVITMPASTRRPRATIMPVTLI